MMKYLLSIILILITHVLKSQTYARTDIENSPEVLIDKSRKLIITEIEEKDQGQYFVALENKPQEKLIKGDYKNRSLTFKFPPLMLQKGLILNMPAGFKKIISSNRGVNAGSRSVGAGNANDKEATVQNDIYTGIAFSDAKTIYRELRNANCNTQLILDIVNHYSTTKKGSTAALSSNPFFSELNNLQCSAIKDKSKMEGLSVNAKQEGAGAIANLSGIDVTKYVQGFADFLRDRIKEEFTLAYLDKLKKTFQETKELPYLLPKTYTLFDTNDPFRIPTIGPAYKAAFSEDLKGLLPNFENMAISLSHQSPYDNLAKDERFIAFNISYRFIDYSANGLHPSEILTLLDERYGYVNDASRLTRVNYSLSLLNILSENLRAEVDAPHWVKKDKALLSDRNFLLIFFGLLSEKYPDIISTSTTASGFPKNTFDFLSRSIIASKSDNANSKLYNFLIIANNIDIRIKEYKDALAAESLSNKERRELTIKYFLNNSNDILNLLEFAVQLTGQRTDTPDFRRWRDITTKSIAVAEGIYSNNVGKVSVNSISLINDFIGESRPKVVAKLTFYTNFITDMAAADSAQQISAVLKKYSEPVGSYQISRKQFISFSLQSYPGLYGGSESLKINGDRKWATSFGLTAPVGLALSFGNKFKKDAASTKSPPSFSAFFSLVDIGAALSYRFNNDSVDVPKKITLGQIFSPGFFGVVGLPNTPLAFKLGWQYSPELRRITVSDNDTQSFGANRWSLGLTADIPVFHFIRK